MSGSESSVPAAAALAESASPLGLTVHSVPQPTVDDDETGRRTRVGRLKMLLVLAVCAAPVVASYFTYFVIRPEGRTNYGALIQPQRPMPTDLGLTELDGTPVATRSLEGHWLLVAVAGGGCDALCEKHLWLQRQLREALGREKERVVKVWLVDDAASPSARILDAIRTPTGTRILRVPSAALRGWLQPETGHALAEHFFVVDPMGHWMMRSPPSPEPRKLKGDVDKLLRASAGWNGER